jgi:RHS repeat-associated protein
VARLGGKKPVPVAAGVMRWLSAAPGAFAVLAALALVTALAASLVRAARRRARPAVALGTALAFLAATTAGCAKGASPPPVGPLAAVYYHGDHLGGVALQTDERGALLAEAAYDPYGGTIVGSTEPYAFPGKELDAETGLYEFGARLYDPAAGLFLSPDPAVLGDLELGLSDPQLLQPYAYVRNSPTSHVDPDGRLGHIALGALAGGLISGGIYLAQAAVTGNFSARSLAAATAGGAVAGALAAATGGASLAAQGTALAAARQLGNNALQAVARGITERAIETGSLPAAVDPGAIAADVFDSLSSGGGRSGKVTQNVRSTAKKQVARAERAVQRSGGTAAEGTVRVRHFTNSKGIKGIENDGVIVARDQNRVFTVKAQGKPGSPRDVEESLGIKRGRGNNYVEFDGKPGEFQTVKNPRTGATETVFMAT